MTVFLRFFRSLALFIPLCIFAYWSLLMLWGAVFPAAARKNLRYFPGGYGYTQTRLEEVKKVGKVQYLFLGSSHAYRGFDNRLFDAAGINSFNLGSSAQTPVHTELLLNRYLSVLQPDTVVYEVYPGTFSADGVESTLDLLSNDQIDWPILQLSFAQRNVKVYNTALYVWTKQLLGLNGRVKEPPAKDDDTYVKGGYVERKLSFHPITSYPRLTWNLNKDQLAAFERIIQKLKSNGTTVILVQAPVSPSFAQSFTNKKEFDSLMTTFGNYLNFNGKLPLKDSLHFYDAHHLNQPGVEIFNKALIQELRGNK
jgi:hypothetical protein